MYRKSSYSFANGNCVEVDDAPVFRKASGSYANGSCTEVAYRKSSACRGDGNGDCAEAGQDGTVILVRDTKQRPDYTVLEFGADAWRTFVAGIKSA